MGELGFGAGVHTHNHFVSLLSPAMEPKTTTLGSLLEHLGASAWHHKWMMFRGALEGKTEDWAFHVSRSELGHPNYPLHPSNWKKTSKIFRKTIQSLILRAIMSTETRKYEGKKGRREWFYLLSLFYVSSPVLGSMGRERAVQGEQGQNSCFHGPYNLLGKKGKNHILSRRRGGKKKGGSGPNCPIGNSKTG